ncbi:MAG: biotin carboxylase N-terminal domain-containing protein [Solirubrobacteraceae bacterium]|jgi:acetyl-CoA/propionyl-CoA carboxylase biotin carboxyl carrier protein
MFDTVLIANRGEIARRVIRTLDRLGVRSVAVYAPADRRSAHVHEADEAVAVPSYLDVGALVAAGLATGAGALHPGYGFLSENPALSRACAAAGVAFVGPPAGAAELMGDKLRAKQAAQAAGLPVVPSFTEDEARAPGAAYPLLVKAAAGGGGRGMRVVHRPEDLDAALAAARREAQAGFGDDRVFIERFLPRARHLEVQVIADAHGTVLHLGERECSLQRRHQKLIEESPSPAVSAELRARLGAEAVALARATGYVNAGTVEFIADVDDPAEHYFLECNARLQVEHPVTELVCGLDLVELQLRVAAGEPLALRQQDVRLRGHAIEARINAEDADRDFLPAAGRVLAYRRAAGSGVRVDDAIETGSEVHAIYDSMLAKVIVHADDRPTALARLDHALARTAILGVTTTTGFLRSLLATDEVRAGRLDTGLIERLAPFPARFADEEVGRAAALISLAQLHERHDDDPFAGAGGWRLSGRRADSWWRLAVGSRPPVEVRLAPLGFHELALTGPGAYAIADAGERREWSFATDGAVIWVGCEGWAWPVRHSSAAEAHASQADGDLRAPMPGQVLLVHAAVGDRVSAGDPLIVLESMKMELVITAPIDGELASVGVGAGDQVALDQPLARVEATG